MPRGCLQCRVWSRTTLSRYGCTMHVGGLPRPTKLRGTRVRVVSAPGEIGAPQQGHVTRTALRAVSTLGKGIVDVERMTIISSRPKSSPVRIDRNDPSVLP